MPNSDPRAPFQISTFGFWKLQKVDIIKRQKTVDRMKSVSRKQDQKNLFSGTTSISFNSEQLPTNPWLTTFKI